MTRQEGSVQAYERGRGYDSASAAGSSHRYPIHIWVPLIVIPIAVFAGELILRTTLVSVLPTWRERVTP